MTTKYAKEIIKLQSDISTLKLYLQTNTNIAFTAILNAAEYQLKQVNELKSFDDIQTTAFNSAIANAAFASAKTKLTNNQNNNTNTEQTFKGFMKRFVNLELNKILLQNIDAGNINPNINLPQHAAVTGFFHNVFFVSLPDSTRVEEINLISILNSSQLSNPVLHKQLINHFDVTNKTLNLKGSK